MLWPVLSLLFILSSASSWVLEVNKNAVTPQLTKGVTLDCHHDASDASSKAIVTLNRIRITKFTANDKWVPVVSLAAKNRLIKSSLTGAKTSGKIDTIANTFLKIRFDVATDDAIGQFMCDVDGYDVDTNVKSVQSKPVQVINQNVASEASVKEILQDLRHENDVIKQMQRKITSLELLSKITKANEDLTTKFNKMNSQISSLTKKVEQLSSEQKRDSGSLSNNVNGLKGRVDQLTGRFSSLETKESQLDAKVNSLHSYHHHTHGIPGGGH